MTTKGSRTTFNSLCTLGLCRKRKGRLKPRAGAFSDIGSVRSSNDDVVFAGNDCRLYVALDGIGGHAGGAEASRIVLEKLRASIESMCESTTGHPDQDLKAAVSQALSDATKEMLRVADETPEYDRMGTVFALGYVVDDTLLYTHVGDSRVYLVRRGRAEQLTSDETYVQLMIDVGVIEPDDVPEHPMRNIVLNAVGPQSTDGDPIVHSKLLLPGDVVLLMTDGVSDKLTAPEMVRLIGEHSDPEQASKALVRSAIEAGSRDNASCVVVRIDRAENVASTKHDDLHFELSKLHEMLSDVNSVDEELKGDMVRIADDIRKALHEDETTELVGLRKQLSERALAFEVSHPSLTSAVSSIADLLASIGI